MVQHTQDSCPVCQTVPYPAGRACLQCGFVGQNLDSIQRLKVLPPWLMLPFIVIVCLIVGVAFYYSIVG